LLAVGETDPPFIAVHGRTLDVKPGIQNQFSQADPVTNTWAMARSYVTTARNAAIADVLVRRLSL